MNTIKLNVIGELTPSAEGGSGGGGNSGDINDNLIYIDLSSVDRELHSVFGMYCITAIGESNVAERKLKTGAYWGLAFQLDNSLKLNAAVYNLDLIVDSNGSTFYTLEEGLKATDMYDFFMSLPRMTKEEYYSLLNV